MGEVGKAMGLMISGTLVYYHCAYRNATLLSLFADVLIVLLCSLAILGLLFRQVNVSMMVYWSVAKWSLNMYLVLWYVSVRSSSCNHVLSYNRVLFSGICFYFQSFSQFFSGIVVNPMGEFVYIRLLWDPGILLMETTLRLRDRCLYKITVSRMPKSLHVFLIQKFWYQTKDVSEWLPKTLDFIMRCAIWQFNQEMLRTHTIRIRVGSHMKSGHNGFCNSLANKAYLRKHRHIHLLWIFLTIWRIYLLM